MVKLAKLANHGWLTMGAFHLRGQTGLIKETYKFWPDLALMIKFNVKINFTKSESTTFEQSLLEIIILAIKVLVRSVWPCEWEASHG